MDDDSKEEEFDENSNLVVDENQQVNMPENARQRLENLESFEPYESSS